MIVLYLLPSDWIVFLSSWAHCQRSLPVADQASLHQQTRSLLQYRQLSNFHRGDKGHEGQRESPFELGILTLPAIQQEFNNILQQRVTYLRIDFFPNGMNGRGSIGISTDQWRCVWENLRLAMDELIQNVFLHSLVVILYCKCLTHPQGVATVRKHHWHNMIFIVKEMTTLEMSNGNLVSVPWTKGGKFL